MLASGFAVEFEFAWHFKAQLSTDLCVSRANANAHADDVKFPIPYGIAALIWADWANSIKRKKKLQMQNGD